METFKNADQTMADLIKSVSKMNDELIATNKELEATIRLQNEVIQGYKEKLSPQSKRDQHHPET